MNACLSWFSDTFNFEKDNYFPGTQNIYTFIGFSDENKLNQSMTNQQFITSIQYTKIYKYPYANVTEENKSLTSNVPKPITPSDSNNNNLPSPSTPSVIKPETKIDISQLLPPFLKYILHI